MSRQRLLTDTQIQWLNDQLPDNSMRNGRIRPGRVMEWADALGIKVNTLRGYIRQTKASKEKGARILDYSGSASPLPSTTFADRSPPTEAHALIGNLSDCKTSTGESLREYINGDSGNH